MKSPSDTGNMVHESKMPEPMTDHEVSAMFQYWHNEHGTTWADLIRRVEKLTFEKAALHYSKVEQEATRQAMERLEPLRHAGAMLSNCAFNLAQRNPGQFTARDIEALDSSRKAWDEAVRALLPPTSPTSEESGNG